MPINPADLAGLKCSFDFKGKRLVGVITEAKSNGYAEPGHIPDFEVTIRGQSGRTVTVSLVESRLSLPDR